MCKKIVVIGPESTGKSTLSRALAEQLHTLWVPEYARQYLETKGKDYGYEDIARIAEGQLASEDELARQAQDYLVCDTDLYVLKVWSEHRFGKTADGLLQAIAVRSYDAYILCDIDLAWAPDPLREHPQPEMRAYFYELYKDIVLHSGLPFVLVRGGAQQRLEKALRFVQEHLPLSKIEL